MSNYATNFLTLEEKEVNLSPTQKVIFKLDKNNKNDKLKLHIREHIITPEYTGYTKNGLNIEITDETQIDAMQEVAYTFFESIRQHIPTQLEG